MIRKVIGTVFSLLFFLYIPLFEANAQELLCNLRIDARQVQSDKQVFEEMEENIQRYLNFQRWGKHEFETHERVRCSFNIIVNSRPSPDVFQCTANIIAYRPVFNSTYETVLLNISDTDFTFRYVPFQQMQFVDNSYVDNLTALLNFYSFIILAIDYDTFSLNGGEEFYIKAQEIVNLASTASQEPGWRSSESQRNRFWLIENLTNSRFKNYHNILYDYHRNGLDLMESEPDKGRKSILGSLRQLEDIQQQNPLIYLLRVFLDAKDDELVEIFGNAFIDDKKEFVGLMDKIDPSNREAYSGILKQK